MSLLDRDPTPEDLEAERDQPRPGVWAGEPEADMRALTQDQTDALVRYELWWGPTRGSGTSDELARLSEALGFPPGAIPQHVPLVQHAAAFRQRGGIDSDSLVRVLARRAWGDRDRLWFEPPAADIPPVNEAPPLADEPDESDQSHLELLFTGW